MCASQLCGNLHWTIELVTTHLSSTCHFQIASHNSSSEAYDCQYNEWLSSCIFNQYSAEILWKTSHKIYGIIYSFWNQVSVDFGNFSPECQQRATPPSVRSLITMVLYGSNAISHKETQPILTIARTIVFNNKRKSDSTCIDCDSTCIDMQDWNIQDIIGAVSPRYPYISTSTFIRERVAKLSLMIFMISD